MLEKKKKKTTYLGEKIIQEGTQTDLSKKSLSLMSMPNLFSCNFLC